MQRFALCFLLLLVVVPAANAVVFINEVFINPPGGADDTKEFIELMGTPGKKLDGYAVAMINGVETKFFPLGSIPPIPSTSPEIDEFFSLDGLRLGDNGLLVIGLSIAGDYPEALPDSEYRRWAHTSGSQQDGIWNGLLDTPSKLGNDGSNTVMLIRNRPGITEADPLNTNGLRWGKDIKHDTELITPVFDNNEGVDKDQYGNGNLDRGEPNNLGGTTLDLKGVSTPGNVSDDLEVVDEVSYEHGRGWEYDLDDRTVDVGSADDGLPQRSVHSLDDPNGINPDALTRVDYRTKGDGWAPVAGSTGEMINGNNWQDTATEQWVRGESTVIFSGVVVGPNYFYDNAVNVDPGAIQPFDVNVPLWLDDAVGPDYDFTVQTSYQIMPGRINPLAVAFVPGDSDRDGDCDADDIAKIAGVFGDDNWIFSNSYNDAPEGDEGDPAAQTRPWDVDATGTNGIEASDLQWTLNFQGSTSGQINGVTYDSTTPSASGVTLNSNSGVEVEISASTFVPSGRSLSALEFGDFVELTVSGEVTGGANLTSDEENGIMQFVHDVLIDSSDVLRVVSIDALGSFNTTRTALLSPVGVGGDLGMDNVNGYATSFTEGLSGSSTLYRVTLRAIGNGSANVNIHAADMDKFATSTPEGVKVGHTDQNGNPSSSTYPAAISVTVVPVVDDEFIDCVTGPGGGVLVGCDQFDFDQDADVDSEDYHFFQTAFN
ncbi:MAG: hypothetical protein DHS20C16_04810 [Phycisphaerae bacterium]|nr:MAG: hypothetical protein DHS20C16_04810 [Phycisphaerae bacterium]